MTLLDFLVWDVLQELVYEKGVNSLRTSKIFRMLSEINGMMSTLDIHNQKSHKAVKKASSSSGKGKCRTYSAHF